MASWLREGRGAKRLRVCKCVPFQLHSGIWTEEMATFKCAFVRLVWELTLIPVLKA